MQTVNLWNPDSVELSLLYVIDRTDAKTAETIFEGFTYDGNLFSMSTSAQINWTNLFFIPDEMFPLNVSTKNDETVYSLALANRQAFYGAALTHKNGALQAGNALKAAAKAATTIAELEAVLSQL